MVDRSCATTATSAIVLGGARTGGVAIGTGTGAGHGNRANVGAGQPAGVKRRGAIDSKVDMERSGAGQTIGGDHTTGFDTTARDTATGGAHVMATDAGDAAFVGHAGATRSVTSA